MRALIACMVCAAFVSLSTARIFSRCELARELYKHGFSKAQLPDWICLVESESSRNTKLTHKNRNGSTDYGLFQINSQYWCSEGPPGKDCNVRCKDLLSDDISKSIECTKKIFKRHGFNAWYGWKDKCSGKKLPDLSSCNIG